MAVTRVHLTVSLPADLWQECRDRWPNRKASHMVTAALRMWLRVHPVSGEGNSGTSS